MFSNTLSFRSSRNVNDQVSHPYKTTGKISIAIKYNLIDIFVFDYMPFPVFTHTTGMTDFHVPLMSFYKII